MKNNEQRGLNNLEYLCTHIAIGIVQNNHSENKEEIAKQIVDQSVAIIEEIEKRGLDTINVNEDNSNNGS